MVEFDRVILIHLRRRPDRLGQIRMALEEAKWPFPEPQLFIAVDGWKVPSPKGWSHGPGVWGCMQSHRQVLQEAILADSRSTLILEDDAAFVPRFADKVKAFLQAVPDDWNSLMIGGIHVTSPQNVSPGVVRCFSTQLTHCYAVREPFTAILYQHLISTHGHCDHRMSELKHKYKVYAPDPFLANQSGSRSDIQ